MCLPTLAKKIKQQLKNNVRLVFGLDGDDRGVVGGIIYKLSPIRSD